MLSSYKKKYLAAGGLVVTLAMVLNSWPGVAQEAKAPFFSGEKLRYAVRWRLVPAGEAEVVLGKVDSPQGQWMATVKANSTGYVSNIYKVQDEYQSTFRNPSFCSNEIRKKINEGERHRDVMLQFDQRRRLALLLDRATAGNAPSRQEQSAIPACVHDILSAFYFTRTQPLIVGQSFDLPVNDGARTVQLHVEVQAKEEVQTPIGKFQAVRLEPDVFSGKLFPEKGRMFVWFTDDSARLPVQMRAQIGVGTITALLTSVESQDNTP